MASQADAATLNVQPRQRRTVYMWLSAAPDGRSVKNLLDEFDIPEPELRETLRKLDAAGLARRSKGMWMAVPLAGSDVTAAHRLACARHRARGADAARRAPSTRTRGFDASYHPACRTKKERLTSGDPSSELRWNTRRGPL